MKKSQKITSIALSIFKLEMTHGHLKWKVSDLARVSRVSRPLIYFYLGKTKKDIFESALKIVCDDIYCMSIEKQKLIRSGQVVKAVMQSRQLINENHFLQVFTHRWRLSNSGMQNTLINYENIAEAQLHKQFPQYSKKQAKLVHVSLHGLLTAPFIEESDVRDLLQILFKDSKYLTISK